MSIFSSDFLGSDDVDAMNTVLDQSRQAGPSRPSKSAERRAILKKIHDCDVDIEEMDKQILELKRFRQQKLDDKAQFTRQLNGLDSVASGSTQRTTNYNTADFPWSGALEKTMKDVFGIQKFRLCQRGVCNANMDSRDIVCVMPTGGGKSLTYQLPAIMGSGCTLVVSPLISLISDQLLHLHKAGVEAVKITGSTTKEENKRITSNLHNMALGKSQNVRPIRLCYVTPEKISKSKTFQSLLQKLADNNKLDRIVIDEAHCVSQLGHDFRPDYKELQLLRKLLPQVPIMALTATCPPKVLDDLLSILGLGKICDGDHANLTGTVYFTAPLYRANLHYKALPKPSNAKKTLQLLADWILEHHLNDSGIVYCLSRKDTETVAEELQKISNGKIRTGFYHADKKDGEKDKLHTDWHEGTIKVVCATIAFGMGIDKSDVRFVIHHSVRSKSLDGFYQESGRAGRDGKDADCVMFYRPQDAWSLAGMLVNDRAEKLFPMINFIQDTKECRKLQFANYFSHSSNLSITAWGDDALKPCGHCDNCERPPGSAQERDVTFEAWQLLKLVNAVCGSKSTFTAAKVATLARSKDGRYASGSGRNKSQGEVDLDAVCGGKVRLDKDDIEFLLVYLWTEHYLKVRYQQTAYSTLVYITSGPMASRLTNMSLEQAKQGGRMQVKCTFPIHTKGRRKSVGGKGKKADEADDADDSDIFDDDDEDEPPPPPRKRAPKRKSDPITVEIVDDDDDEEDEGGGGWSFNLRADPPSKRQRTMVPHREEEVIEIDSD
ncbi:P-loop containing nucleoside triphosphate hydrolase protein [Mucidula mucida]|nr:P-loop containing nucleoside triphosphate hydrolase protein [Mucidula mucida]